MTAKIGTVYCRENFFVSFSTSKAQLSLIKGPVILLALKKFWSQYKTADFHSHTGSSNILQL